MLQSTDQLGNNWTFANVPKRIISLVPSQSEFLWDLGLGNDLIGITKFCIHPKEMFQRVQRVGGTKNLDIDLIETLKPDLIIANKEENDKAQIEFLSKKFPVWLSDIYNFEDAFHMMLELGKLLNRESQAVEILTRAKQNLEKCKDVFKGESVAYFIWNEPYYLAASHTFIDCVLQHAGFKNALEAWERYPHLNAKELRELNPDWCFLSSEPFPFQPKHAEILQNLLPGKKIIFVNGEYFSWYGSRLIRLHEYLLQLKDEVYAG